MGLPLKSYDYFSTQFSTYVKIFDLLTYLSDPCFYWADKAHDDIIKTQYAGYITKTEQSFGIRARNKNILIKTGGQYN